MTEAIDKTADCATCHQQIEHYAGVPGSQWMTPFWRHTDRHRPHPAVPAEATIREVAR